MSLGSWSGPRGGPAEAKDAILQAKSLQKRTSKNGPEKGTQNDGEGATKGPKMGPKNRPKTHPKIDPNIISLRIGSLRLSRVGVWPCRRKCGEVVKVRVDLKYVQTRKGENEIRSNSFNSCNKIVIPLHSHAFFTNVLSSPCCFSKYERFTS